LSFNDLLLTQIEKRVQDVFTSSGPKLVGEIRKDYTGFELLGFDFMVDNDMNLFLIEVNTNPCLETHSCILS
jgi:D-alanine-D-alanine ligase-like ATP-grasp enzyme